jgi:Kdo2-lipid IVA lauroyltransferase/acyltransferase
METGNGELHHQVFSNEINVFYKPLSNTYVDRYIRNTRSKSGSKLVSIYKTAKIFENNIGKVIGYVMAADQSPSNPKRAYWINFLGRETAFLHGPEYYAIKYNIPILFIDIQRVKRGYYELTSVLISDDPTNTKEGEITKKYAKMLEKAILNKPENWLWSHRRWKLKRDPNQELIG